MGKNLLILGGGFGGLAAADTLRKGLTPEHTVTLVDRQPLFFMGLTKLWILNGTRIQTEAVFLGRTNESLVWLKRRGDTE